MNLNATGSVTGTVTADSLVVVAGGSINLTTTVTSLDAESTGSGDITITETDDIQLIRILSSGGTITITAGGDIDATQIDAGASGNANLNATGSVTGTVTADSLIVVAGGSIELTTTVTSLDAESTGSGDITIIETDDIQLIEVLSLGGTITVIAGGDIHATQIDVGASGNVNLNATGSVTGSVTAYELVVVAGGSIDMTTTVTSLDAESTGSGDITVTETDGILLGEVVSADGAISIVAGDSITVIFVESLTDKAENRISLTAGGDMLIDLLRAGMNAGEIFLAAAGDIREVDAFDPDVDLAGRVLHVTVGGEFGSPNHPDLELELDIGTLAFYGHDLILRHQGDIELIVEATGIVDITATGSVTVTTMTSGAHAITISVGGDIVIDYMDAGALAGTIKLVAAGSIYEAEDTDADADIIAHSLDLAVGQDIGNALNHEVDLETDIDDLVAVSENGWIILNEVSDLNLVHVVAGTGIMISAFGNILITGVLAADDVVGSVSLISSAEIYMTSQIAITTYALNALSQSGQFLRTAVTELEARISGSGILEVHEADQIVLRDVTNNDGTIRVIAEGSITAVHVESETDASGNTVGLISTAGDVLIDYVAAGINHGQVSVSAAGEIKETDNYDSYVDLKARVVILAAGGEIDGHHKYSPEKLEKNVGDLFTAENGKKLRIHEHHHHNDVSDFDLEIFLDLQGELDVHVDGSILVTYLTGSGKKADLKSHHGDITVEYIDLQQSKDIHLHADRGAIHLTSDRYAGEVAGIHGGRDVRLHARYDIQLDSDVTAGHNLELKSSCGSIVINAPLTAGNDVKIDAETSIVINADVTAGDDIHIKISQYGELELNADLIAGDDVHIDRHHHHHHDDDDD